MMRQAVGSNKMREGEAPRKGASARAEVCAGAVGDEASGGASGNAGGVRPALTLRVLLMVLLAVAAGCEVKPGVVFPEVAGAPRWPPPPDEARITWVGQLATSADLKPGLNGWEALGQAIFGQEPSRSMLTPIAVCTDDGNRVFVADSNAQLVHVFDLKTRQYAMWKPGKGEPALAQPVGIAWDRMGQRLLVADSAAGAIFIFNNAGGYAGQMGGGVLQRPVGLAADGQGRVLVADCGAHQVLVFGADGSLRERLGTRGEGLGQFNFPTNVALDRAGMLYVSDSLNFRVQKFDGQHKAVAAFGKKGDLPGYFAQPKGLATDSEGHVYVVDGQFENVQIFDGEGRVLTDFGEEGGGPGQFWLPTGIFIDSHDRLWVTDSYNRRVQVFDYKAAQPAAAPPATAQPATAPPAAAKHEEAKDTKGHEEISPPSHRDTKGAQRPELGIGNWEVTREYV